MTAASGALCVERLVTRGFRNLGELTFEPGPHFNVLSGDNGQGKSNLLESIELIGSLRSFRGATSAEMIAQGAASSTLALTLSRGGGALASQHRVVLHRDAGREVQVDGKRPRNRALYLGSIQTVLFHPGDLLLIAGAPEARRGFLDRILERFDMTYAVTLASYERGLRSRNRLLKMESPDRRAIRAFDEVLAPAGAIIGQARERLVRELGELVLEAFQAITGEPDRLSIEYQPRVEPEVDALRAALERSLEKDLARGFTAEGPHADELGFALDGVAVKRYGSQGQHRALVLALKLAELYELTRRIGRVPILLLDDVSSELDRTRSQRLFSIISECGGQVFLTTTQPELISISARRVDFHITGGNVSPASR